MWGSALGWTISAILALAVVAALLCIDASGRRFSRADAFGLDRVNSSELTLPDPSRIVGSMPDNSDAGAVYRPLIGRMSAHRAACEAFVRAGRLSDLDSIAPVLDAFRSAGKARRATLFVDSPGELINYESPNPSLESLDLAARTALRAALLLRSANPSDSRRLFEAVFVLGYHLFNERLTYDQLDLGLRLLAESAAGLRSLAQTDELDPSTRVSAIDAFDGPRLALARERVIPMAARIRSLDGRVVSANAGNVMHWARHAGDRVWRVEAILAVGRLRHFTGNPGLRGDSIAAERTLDELRSDPDLVIQSAVRAASALTLEQLRAQR